LGLRKQRKGIIHYIFSELKKSGATDEGNGVLMGVVAAVSWGGLGVDFFGLDIGFFWLAG
jgi:hypothetical protein